MGGLFRKTSKMLASRGSVLREELTVEGQKLLDLYNDPNVSAEEKEKVKKQLDGMIADLEQRVETTRRLREQKTGKVKAEE